MTRRKPGRMARIGNQVVEETNFELAAEEIGLLLRTSIDWEALRPQVNNTEVYDRLIEAVQESTDRNENIAQLQSRLKQLGQKGLDIAKKVVSLIKE